MKTIALYFVAVICLNPYSTGSNSNKVKLEKMLDKFVLILILLEVTQMQIVAIMFLIQLKS